MANVLKPAGALAALIVLPTQSWGLARISGGDLTLTAGTSVRYDSNISANSDEIDDIGVGYRASLDYIKQSRYVMWGAGIGFDGTEYFDESDFSSFDYSLNLYLSPTDEIGGRRFKVSGSLMYDRQTEADADLGAQITRIRYGATAGIVFQGNSKYSVGVDGFYNVTDPDEDNAAYVEETHFGGSVTAYYHFSDKLDYTLSSGLSETEGDGSVTSQIDSTSYNASIGVSGTLSPKLTGNISLGYQWREYDLDRSSDAAPLLSASLQWVINDLSSATLAASHDFGSVSSNFNSEQTSVSLSYARTLNRRWSMGAGFSYRTTDFSTVDGEVRSNDLWEANTSVSYLINKWASASAGVIHSTQDSDDAFFEYDRNQVYLSLTATW